MDKEFMFINYLPSELIVFGILSRLPVRSIAICRCVCKSWLNLVGTHEFVKLHLSQSAPGPVFNLQQNNNIFEFNDDLHLKQHKLHYRLFTEFNFPHAAALRGSADGLLLFLSSNYDDHRLYICNPITRDYIELPEVFGNGTNPTYGFGASKVSGQHKVVMNLHGFNHRYGVPVTRTGKSECRVYTLGTRSWRSIAAASSGDPLMNTGTMNVDGAALVNGNLHWFVTDANRKSSISCFDLETEVFSAFPCPPGGEAGGRLSVVGNCLCFCQCSSDDGLIVWLAKYENSKCCWSKEFNVITSSIIQRPCYPTKVFRDGDILIASFMFGRSKEITKTTPKLGIFEQLAGAAIIYTPSFLSLKSFENERATSF